mgnify:CR=1 FL=1
MNYVSTRGQAPTLSFDDALLSGLARDGGLYVPEEWPVFSTKEIESLRGLSYPEMAIRIIRPFTVGVIPEVDLATMVNESYAGFDDPAVAPLKQLGDGKLRQDTYRSGQYRMDVG